MKMWLSKDREITAEKRMNALNCNKSIIYLQKRTYKRCCSLRSGFQNKKNRLRPKVWCRKILLMKSSLRLIRIWRLRNQELVQIRNVVYWSMQVWTGPTKAFTALLDLIPSFLMCNYQDNNIKQRQKGWEENRYSNTSVLLTRAHQIKKILIFHSLKQYFMMCWT